MSRLCCWCQSHADCKASGRSKSRCELRGCSRQHQSSLCSGIWQTGDARVSAGSRCRCEPQEHQWPDSFGCCQEESADSELRVSQAEGGSTLKWLCSTC